MIPVQLNDEQVRAAESRARKLLLSAGPGCGKTQAVLARVVDLILSSQVRPDEILVLCFTRAACADLRRKLVDYVGQEVAEAIHVRTFHALAWHLIRTHDLAPKQVHAATEAEETGALESIYGGAAMRPIANTVPRRKVHTLATQYAALGYNHPECQKAREGEPNVERVYRLWVERLWQQDRIPLHNLLVLLEGPILAKQVRTWAHVIVDEAHDATPFEWAVAENLSTETAAFVFDERQCIFPWRGGMTPERIQLALQEQSQQADADLIHLHRVYRFGQRLCTHANAITQTLPGPRIGAWLEPATEDESIVRRVAGATTEEVWNVVRDLETRYEGSGIAVLTRTNEQAQRIAGSLEHSVMNTRERDPLLGTMIDMVRLSCEGQDNTTFFRLANAAGLDARALAGIQRRAGMTRRAFAQYRLVVDELPEHNRALLSVPGRHREGRPFGALLNDTLNVLEDSGTPPTDAIPMGCDDVELLNKPVGGDLLHDLLEIDRTYGSGIERQRRMGVPLVSTVHSAKGLEWDAVVLHVSDTWPTERGWDRYVYFVGCTRARRELVLYQESAHPGAFTDGT